MKTYLLDTSVIIDFLRGKEHTVNIISSLEGELTSSYLCMGEMFEGVYRSTNPTEQEARIMDFFRSLSYLYSVGGPIAKQFGALRAQLRQKGEGLADVDLLIAATCLVHNLELVTGNVSHFSRIQGLNLLGIQAPSKM